MYSRSEKLKFCLVFRLLIRTFGFMKHFHPLQTDIARPKQFNDPFDYEPHPLSILAVEEVQQYIMEHPEIKEDADQGKMFGVLVVYLPRKDEGERRKEITSEIQDEGAGIGFLAAYSGLLAGRNDWEWFVPPVFDAQDPDGYFKVHEREITEMNHEVELLEKELDDFYHQSDYLKMLRTTENLLSEHEKKMKTAKVLRDMNVPLNKRVRLIMGTNEEKGSACLAHYVEKEGSCDYGFTPDGEFPGVHGEKGMVAAVYRSKLTGIRAIQGGTARNVVCPKCTVTVDKASFSRKKLEDYFNNNDLEFSIAESEKGIDITVVGVAAHASTPELGVNAISWLFMGLKEAGYQDPFVNFYCSHIGLNTDGEGLGCKCEDEYGALTLNAGVIGMKDGIVEGSIDIRFPVTFSSRKVIGMMKDRLSDEGGEVEVLHGVEPLFFPPDSPLVTSLLSAYQEVTGDFETMPMTIGGGTYAKEIENTIAFGCAFPGKDYRIHNSNEWVPVDELLLQAEIYVRAILKLLSL